MAVIHVKNIHNHKIKVGFRNELLPPYFDGYVDTLTGNIVDPVSNVDTFLQSVKNDVDEAINKLAGFEDALSCTVTVAEVDSRLEAAEERIKDVVTCANSKKEIESFKTTDFTKLLDPSTLLSCANSSMECYYVKECVPVGEYMKGLEPGIYLGQLSKSFTSESGTDVYMYKNGETYYSGRCYACGRISLIARSCLVVPYTCCYGCVAGYQTYAPAFIFQVSEDDIKNAYVCNIIGFEKCRFYFYSSYTNCPSTYGIDNSRLCNIYCDVSLSYCACDWYNKVLMSFNDYLSKTIPEFYKKANEKIITTSAIRLQ